MCLHTQFNRFKKPTHITAIFFWGKELMGERLRIQIYHLLATWPWISYFIGLLFYAPPISFPYTGHLNKLLWQSEFYSWSRFFISSRAFITPQPSISSCTLPWTVKGCRMAKTSFCLLVSLLHMQYIFYIILN